MNLTITNVLGFLLLLLMCDLSYTINWLYFSWLNDSKIEPNIMTHGVMYNKTFLDIVHQLKTMDENKLTLSAKEIQLMTTRYSSSSSDMVEMKESVLIKYKKKVQSLQCTFGVIIKYLLVHFKNVIIKLKNPLNFDYEKYIYYQYADYTAMMFSILFMSRTVPHSWLWIFHTKLVAAIDWQNHKKLIPDAFFNDYLLNIELSNFLKACERDSYLSVSLNENPTHVNAKMDLNTLTENIIYPLFNGFDLWRIYEFQHSFNVENMLLTALHPENVIFEVMHGIQIDWSGTQQRLSYLKNKCLENYKTHNWINEPFACNAYHEMIMLILKARLLCYTWVHLYIYHTIGTSVVSEARNLYHVKQNMLEKAIIQFYPVYIQMVDYIDAEDNIFWEISRLLSSNSWLDYKQLQLVMFTVLDVIITSLITLSVNNVHENITNNSFITTHKKLINTTLMEENTLELQKFLSNIQDHVKPLDIHFINFYRKGNISFSSSFYHNEDHDV
ncbi:uncharacterized protein LOC126844602 [Adelges cooleyi]|uniref:uncharacterized protein LOC126844602 n=1 Tax=Adelges cooleyi TaxID=133065 RepID=UPI00217FF182|nr:uncharacterized protein LOC126844602 [Adelges cooleyi]